ncbi:glucose-1-phosphate adenylyltransferase subunit GlgD [Pediococcus claussenii]|uniref:Glucose-1-phosphate adenylyltransferase, GlgD subunit n=1 Tax=Pediococcus claussenii (strain ATCC BAA-344 / DSM 14800 / JCM 18046 / KCTC 3811 / LMG 21948 / P06) TaxID=701521 RepID=G8PAM5_PEDCP|nr:glucose-1-phosphate adenylyltransferase subunit GlgD [Pediococcus claussenii]AEV94584.1 glucose-1-phosphate adenylyltransferase, GlgD subunit [Pediococcus claussenii ATCC BAA-344]ANZ69795.1 glucose-1-phosphate adenylyltransferase subunit GlgD [Pediococcus claussenii]ANZ71612.1 glucose-1-phosphate adenylyltransferase subunit GlgD [Pediococcus claussenii]KRN19710.1 glgD protein [Pediococcus claussenii]
MKQGSMCAVINLVEDWENLKPLTNNRPVGTLPFAGRYRLIDFPLSAISNAGIRNVMIEEPSSGRSVQDHIRSGKDWDMDTIRGGIFTFPYNDLDRVSDQRKEEIKYHYYDNEILYLRKTNAEYAVVVGSHNVSDIDLQALLRYHQSRGTFLTVAYKKMSITDLDPNNTVLQLTSKGNASAVVQVVEDNSKQKEQTAAKNLDIYLMSTMDLIDILHDANRKGDISGIDQLLKQAVMQHGASAFEYTGFYANIHDIKSYYDASMNILDEENFRALLYTQRPIYTKVKNEVPTFFTKESKVTGSLCGTGGYVEGTIEHSVVFRNVLINRNATIKNSVIMQGVRIGVGTTVENAVIDKNVVIGPNMKIKGTPEKPVVIQKDEHLFHQREVANK